MKKIFYSILSLLLLSNYSFAQFNTAQIAQIYSGKQSVLNLNSNDLSDFVITDQYTDQHNGITHVYLRQRVNGIEIFDANSNMHIDRNGKLISLNNSFVSNIKQKAESAIPTIGVQTALANVGTHLNMNVSNILSKADMPMVNNLLVINDASVSDEPIKIKLHYLTVDNALKLVYNIEIFNNATGDWWNVRVNAQNGAIIEKNNWTVSCNFSKGSYSHSYNFESFALPQTENILQENKSFKTGSGSYNVLPLPIESPSYGSRQIVSSIATSNGSPYGWHDTDGVIGADYTITRGNNVFAYDDRKGTSSKDYPGISPNGGSSLIFDYPFSRDSSCLSNLNAAITNLFYLNNSLHDIYYNYGFTEFAGNYQTNNYGKGGAQGDYVKAEAQDGAGTTSSSMYSNANFSAPVDGQNGRMQMYVWPQQTSNYAIVNSPNSIANYYNAIPAAFGPKKYSSLTSNIVLMKDSQASTYRGCTTLGNRSDLAGKIAVCDRNTTCAFTTQILNAQNSGAIAVIVIQNTSSTPIQMTGSSSGITIPSVMISLANGNILKSKLTLDSIVNITLDAYFNDSIDGDFDNGVVVHESGHGVSIRLTGGPSNSNCLNNGEQAGEGWSDFFALALTAKSGDKAEDGRGVGAYVLNQPTTGLGIRTYKYSRDMNINPFTYDSIKKSMGDIHFSGSVWCTVLWDLYWNMVDKYGWSADILTGTGGNNKTILLVMDGLKLQPCSPGFLDSRNAIILADSMDFGGANKGLIWRTFARRGMGYSAYEGSTNSLTDGTQAFDMPPQFAGLNSDLDLNETIKLAPNPTTGHVQLNLPSAIKNAHVTIVDITGKNVFDEAIQIDINGNAQLNLEGLNNGIYFISVNSGNKIFHSKILLSK
ncbi:MAG: T9SS-dependent M36 family metallopeptidase [Bacteroidota bacterium]